MNASELVQSQHLNRKAVIYLRQSTPQQVLTNTEGLDLQLAMAEQARRLGWPKERIETVESDLGLSGQSTAGRDGYRKLLAEVALGKVGIVLSYESTRLSRNCTDWYPLLDLCAYNQCLIADRDGVYDPSSPNGRLLLGMKGILSEVELHTLRGRLIAGIQNKAQRGELALSLPAGLVRLEEGPVVKDPDLQVQQAVSMVFETFEAYKSASKVVRWVRDHGLKLPRRYRNQETRWRTPSAAAVLSILRNPAYAGAFVYGRTRHERRPGAAHPQQRRRPRKEWKVIVHDRYPAYLSWESFERIQSILDDNWAEYDRNKSRGVPRPGAALLQGLLYCGECGHKMLVQYKGGNQYLCNYLRQQTQAPVCQLVRADPLDHKVVEAFFEALAPAELDLYEKALGLRHQQQEQVDLAQKRQLQRLQYEADLARRRYERADPDNRLVAAELESRWEAALQTLEQAKQEIERLRDTHSKVVALRFPHELRSAFESIGRRLPQLWARETLSREQRKALLRSLIEKVVTRYVKSDTIEIRIAWRGGHVTEMQAPVTVGSVRKLSNYSQMEAAILQMVAEGRSDQEIATLLTEQGFRSPLGTSLLASTVRNIRLEHRIIRRYTGPRPRVIPGFLTLPQLASTLGIKPHWIYHLIRQGVIHIERDPQTRLYLFPDQPETLDSFRQLQAGAIDHLSY